MQWDASRGCTSGVWAPGPNRTLAESHGFFILQPSAPDMSLMMALQHTNSDPRVLPQLKRELSRLWEDAPSDLRTLILWSLFLFETGRAETDRFTTMLDTLRTWRDEQPEVVDQVLEWVSR